MKKITDLKAFLKSPKAKNIIVFVGILGIVLIALSSIVQFGEKKDEELTNVDEYRVYMQDSLSEMLSKIDGVGDVSVLLTIENSAEGVYLENNQTKTKEIEPVVRGVVVACGGGENPVVRSRVSDAVTKALGISSSKVYVTKLQE